ncbi:MAG TPA: nicotinamide riboside transporter PnuC [Galbitalea sp.]
MILDWLNTSVVTGFGETISVVEVIGFVTGALCVWAVTREWTWNWPMGILNNLAFIVLFVGAGLYADTALQIVFVALGVYGWVLWTRGRRAKLPIRRVTARELVVGLALTAVATVAVAYLLAAGTNSVVPWPDAFILAASLWATWLQAKATLEQWWVWIVVDLVSIPLYAIKHLDLTATLYTGFLALCIYGLIRWTRDYRRAAPGVERLLGVEQPRREAPGVVETSRAL